MSFDTLLNQVGNVSRFTQTGTDEAGQLVKTWADIYTNQPCRLASAGGREVNKDAVVVVADYKLFCGDIDVTERDRWTINAVVYEILLVESFSDSASVHHKQCLVQVVR